MARAAKGAGALAAPNSSLAGGPAGFTTFFLGTAFLAATRRGFAACAPSSARMVAGAPARASAHTMLVERIPSPPPFGLLLFPTGAVRLSQSISRHVTRTALFSSRNSTAPRLDRRAGGPGGQPEGCHGVPAREGQAEEAPRRLVAADHAGGGEVVEEAAGSLGQGLGGVTGLGAWPELPLRPGVVDAERAIREKRQRHQREQSRCRAGALGP